MKDDDNVTPIRKEIPNIQDYNKIPGVDYKGPSASIATVLKAGGFDEQAVDRGWIELRIVAAFTETGCMIHGYSASTILNPPKVDLPAMPVPSPEEARNCEHHWRSDNDGAIMACQKCGLAMGARAWASAYAPKVAPRGIIMPGDES